VNNHPSTLFEKFLKERIYLNNVTPRTIVWYRTAFSHQQDSTKMAEEIGAGEAERFQGDVPRQLRQRGREHQGQHRALGPPSLEPPGLHAMRDEVVGITTTPRGLRARALCGLTRRRRTRTLPVTDAAVRHKPGCCSTISRLYHSLAKLPEPELTHEFF
jgi:hypothetical protein